MTTSAQRGHMAFCAYNTPVGDGDFTPTDTTKFPWQRHKALQVNTAPQEFADIFPPEVGEQIYPTGTYKMGAFAGGTFVIQPRLSGAFGHLLYAAAGSQAVSASGAGYSGGTQFKPAADTTYLPWLALRRYVPAESGIGQTEYLVDCRLSAMTLTLPQMGIMTAECAVVGRKPMWENAEDTSGAAFEASDSVAMSCKTTVNLPAFATELGGATAGKFTGAQIIIANGTTTPQQEMILGSYYPDTFLPMSRSVSLRLIYKWKDPALFKKLWQQAAAAPQTYVDQEWTPIVVSGPVEITSTAVNNVGASGHPYRLVFHSDNVDWTMSAPVLAPGQMVQAEITGIVKAAATPWWIRLDNGVVGYTFGT